MQAWSGMFGSGSIEGLVSPDYAVFDVLDGYRVDLILQRLKAPDLVGQFVLQSKGIGSGFNRLYTEHFGAISISLPPAEEQEAMVRFLEHAHGRIERALRAKRKLVALLNEQKQAIIQRAVTKGLNPAAPLKPSGIPWLADIPCHWHVRRLKFLADIKTGSRDTVDRVDDGTYPFFVRSQTVERIDTHSFDGEAVLTAGDGAGVAKVFHYANGKFDYHQRVYKFSNFREIIGKFFFHYFKSTLRFEALDASAKSTVDSLRLPLLQNFPTLVPPHAEQTEIVAWIVRKSSPFEATAARLDREIGLLREYRTRLTADVITGKLDVREVAKSLPDEELIQSEEASELEDVEPEEELAAV